MVVLPLPQPRRPSPGAAAPTDPRSRRGGGTEEQEAEQEASPAAAFSRGSDGRGGAASGAAESPPPGWGECAARVVGKLPGAESPAPVPAFVSGAPAAAGAGDRRCAGRSGLAGGSEGPATTPLSLAGLQLSAEGRCGDRKREGWQGWEKRGSTEAS